MKCPTPELLAEAVTSGDEAVLAHAVECTQCQVVLDDQRDLRALMQQLPDPPLSRAHRETLAAEILAQADMMPAVPRGRLLPIVAISVAVAAIIALLAYLPGRSHAPDIAVSPPAPAPAVAPAPPPSVTPTPAPAPPQVVEAPVPAPKPAAPKLAALGGGGQYARDAKGEVVKLSGGDVTVDSVGTKPVRVVNGDTEVGVKGAKVKVIAKRGVIAQVAVFAGSAQVTVAGKTVVIEAGMTWDRTATREDSLAAFRTGWEALRAGNNAEAIASFDLATDDVVAEDAMYWAAIASERRKDTAGALRRYRELLDRFPKSPRADAARDAITRLAP